MWIRLRTGEPRYPLRVKPSPKFAFVVGDLQHARRIIRLAERDALAGAALDAVLESVKAALEHLARVDRMLRATA